MFQLISLGKRALQVTEKQLETTSHNISNVNTEGYSRQRVLQESAYPIDLAFMNVGTGVYIQEIQRMRDENLDTEYRSKATEYGSWGSRSEILAQVEKSLNEPSDYGLSNKIDKFFSSWDALASNPSQETYRINIATAAEDMTNSFNNIYNDLVKTRDSINLNVEDAVNNINAISDQIATVLVQIQEAESQNKEACDLRDTYDKLVDDLSEYGNIQIQKRENNQVIVYLGTDEIARNGHSRKLGLQTTKDGDIDISNPIWEDGEEEINGLKSGKLLSLIDLRDNTLKDYMQDLDTIALALTEKVNEIHLNGYDNNADQDKNHLFFDDTCTGAKDFKVSNIILENPNNISASLSGEEGDNRIALEIADLKNQAVIDDKLTITQAYSQLVYQIGADASYCETKSESTKLNLDQTNSFRESVKGVSINEETANLIKFQQMYQAAAKIVSIADEMLTTIIGLV